MSKKTLEDLLYVLKDLEYEEDEKLELIETVVGIYDLRTDDCDNCHENNTVVLIDGYPCCLNCGIEFPEHEVAECKKCDGRGIIKEIDDPDDVDSCGYIATCLGCGEKIPPYECKVCGAQGYDGFEWVKWFDDDAPNGGYVALCPLHSDEIWTKEEEWN